jgi:hypothetical protein
MWTCDECKREFGRQHQSHLCAPALTLEEYFAAGPASERAIVEAVTAHLESVGPVRVEAVAVGVFFKRTRTFAELRPRRRWTDLSILLTRVVRDERIARTQGAGGLRRAYIIRLYEAEDVDETVRDWLTESYLTTASE